jgi:ABC-2 type transport system ATP-binding protein
MSKSDAGKRAVEILTALDLTDAADRTCKTYSGGMRRRLNIGIGMVHKPAVLFLDEPTTGLDPQARARLWEEIRKLRETGTTVFLTTHYLEEADALCDRLAIIDHGKIVAEGSPDELKHEIAGDILTVGVNGHGEQVVALLDKQPYVREACLEDGLVRLYVDHGETAVPNVLRLLDSNGLSPSTMDLHRPSLDDVFLKKTGRSLREPAA